MTHFVHDGENIFQRIAVVQKHIRLAVVGTEAVCAGRLSLIFIDIQPAFIYSFLQLGYILFAKRSQTGFHDLNRLFIWNLFLRQFHQRNIYVVHFQFVHAENSFAKQDVAVKVRQIFVHHGDQVVVDIFRNVAAGQGRLTGRTVSPDPCSDHICFYVIIVVGGEGIDQSLVGFIHVGKSRFADFTVMAFHEGDIVAVGQGNRIAIFICNGSEGHIRIIQHGENVIGGSGDFAHLRQNVFFCSGQDMSFFTQCIFQHELIGFQVRFFRDIRQNPLFRRFQQFRGEEGHGSADFRDDRIAFVIHGLIFGFPVIFVFFHMGIDKGMLQLQPYGIAELQCISKGTRRFCQMTLKCSECFGLIQTFLQILFPLGFFRIHGLNVPFIFLFDFFSLF